MSTRPAAGHPPSTRDAGLGGFLRRADLPVLAVGLLLLLAGWVVRGQHLDRIVLYRGKEVMLEHPAGWLTLPAPPGEDDGAIVTLTDVTMPETFKPRIQVASEPLPAQVKPADLRDYVLLNLQGRLTLFHLVSERKIKAGGREALRLDFAFALNPVASPDDPAATDIPVTVRAAMLAFFTDGRLVTVQVSQPVSQHRADPGLADRVLSSVRPAGNSRAGAPPGGEGEGP